MIEISITTQNKKISFDRRLVSSISKDVFKRIDFMERGKRYILEITFLPKDEMRKLNYKYRGIDKTTKSLAFLYGINTFSHKKIPIPIGEVLFNEEILKKRREFIETFIHALLHIAGYDHSRPKERKEMFELQKEILKEIKRRG